MSKYIELTLIVVLIAVSVYFMSDIAASYKDSLQGLEKLFEYRP